MTASTLNIFFPEEHRTAELLDRFEQLVRSNADQTRIDENHDAIIKLIGSICGRIEPSQPRRFDRTQPGSPEIGSLGWRSNIKCLRPTVPALRNLHGCQSASTQSNSQRTKHICNLCTGYLSHSP